jgi:hypothetical protein
MRQSLSQSRRVLCRVVVAVSLLVAVTGATVAPAAAARSPQGPITNSSDNWLNYLDTHVGQSCTLSGSTPQGASAKTVTTLLSISSSSLGTTRMYRDVATTVAAAGAVPKRTTIVYPYTVLPNGELRTEPGSGTLKQGLQWALSKGSILYPSISDLKALSGSSASPKTVALSATTPKARRRLAKVLVSGSTLYIRLSAQVYPAPAQHNITTPSGIYTDFVGIKLNVVSATALNLKSKYASDFAAMSDELIDAFSGSAIYFAHGMGMVRSDADNVVMLRTGCAR